MPSNLDWNGTREYREKASQRLPTALRINAYFEFFGGVGYDQGFTAKVGVFGTIDINNENRFLTRKYLKNTNERDVRARFHSSAGRRGRHPRGAGRGAARETTLVSLGYGTAWRFNDWERDPRLLESASERSRLDRLAGRRHGRAEPARERRRDRGERACGQDAEPRLSRRGGARLARRRERHRAHESGRAEPRAEPSRPIPYPFSTPMLSRTAICWSTCPTRTART